jgi:hypothetical protein
MLEEYQAVTSPTVKRRPFPAAGPVPPGDGVAPPLAAMAPRSSSPTPAAAHERMACGAVGWVAVELVVGLGLARWHGSEASA